MENKAHERENSGSAGALPPPSRRNWGDAQDFAQWEKRANV